MIKGNVLFVSSKTSYARRLINSSPLFRSRKYPWKWTSMKLTKDKWPPISVGQVADSPVLGLHWVYSLQNDCLNQWSMWTPLDEPRSLWRNVDAPCEGKTYLKKKRKNSNPTCPGVANHTILVYISIKTSIIFSGAVLNKNIIFEIIFNNSCKLFTCIKLNIQ
jgi:hypothetical protein